MRREVNPISRIINTMNYFNNIIENISAQFIVFISCENKTVYETTAKKESSYNTLILSSFPSNLLPISYFGVSARMSLYSLMLGLFLTSDPVFSRMTHFTVVKISRFLECFGSQILHDRIKSLTEEGDRGYEVPKRWRATKKRQTLN